MADQNQPGTGEGAGSPAPPLLNFWDTLIALAILAGCLVLYIDSMSYSTPNALLGHSITPALFPRTVLFAIVVMTVLMPFENYFLMKKGVNLDDDRRRPIRTIVFFTAGSLALVVGVMPWAGTYLSMVLATVLLPILWGERRYWLVAIYAALFPAVVGYIFVQGLLVTFVPGFIGHVFR
jgi:hypothetical protein